VKVLRLLATGLGSAALIALGTTSAFAGEVTGTGENTRGPAHAQSICAYSGLNDDPAEEPGKTQSYGQGVRAGLKGLIPGPGEACNGRKGFLSEP